MLEILDIPLVEWALERKRDGPQACLFDEGAPIPVTNALMPPHEPRHSYERCIVCHKTFRVYRSRVLRPGGIFCTQRCFWQAWQAFRRALATGQLEDILAMPVSQEVLKTDAPATRRRQL